MLIQRLIAEREEREKPSNSATHEVRLPLLPKERTGAVLPVTGADLDEISLAKISLPDVKHR